VSHSLAAQITNVPAELRQPPQWVTWRYEQRDPAKKPTKVPYNPRTGGKADTTASDTWATCAEAVTACSRHGHNGVGFVFTADDPYFGIDLDQCRNAETGHIAPWAQTIVRRLDTYTEVTPSGTGLHIIGKGTLPPGQRRTGSTEMYDQKRFFTVTGQALEVQP